MRAALLSLAAGSRAVGRSYGLALLVLGTNLALALLLAVPFALLVERDLAHTGAASGMMYGFDYDWWSRFAAESTGVAASFAPDLVGTGFAARNLDLLLRGQLPGGLFAREAGPDPAILGVGVLYLLLQVLLTGGLLGVFRAPRGSWTVRSLVHGCGFYCGRLLRVSLLALTAAGVVFAVYAALADWLDGLAREAVSERTALALGFGQRALLLVALLAVHAVSSYAKVILVAEERRSALLAFVSSAGFCLRRSGAVVAQYLVVATLGVALFWLFGAASASLTVVGFRTQLVALALAEVLVALRIALRLGLLASQMELHRARRA